MSKRKIDGKTNTLKFYHVNRKQKLIRVLQGFYKSKMESITFLHPYHCQCDIHFEFLKMTPVAIVTKPINGKN